MGVIVHSTCAQKCTTVFGDMQVEMAELERAIYAMDEQTLSLEQMKALYQIRATPDELEMIHGYLAILKGSTESGGDTQIDGYATPSGKLTAQDRFVLALSNIHKFAERVECWSFRARFSEYVFAIQESLEAIDSVIMWLYANPDIMQFLALVREVGNRMNGRYTHYGA